MSIKIYLITNLCNDKKYVGKTALTLEERFTQHIRLGCRENNRLINEAIIEYGKRNFNIQLLEEVDEHTASLKETQYIKKYLSHYKDGNGYNMKYETSIDQVKKYHGAEKIAIENNLNNKCAWNKGISFSEESKQKISQTKKHRHKNGLYKKYGHKHTEETKQKLSLIAKNRPSPSQETRNKLSENSSNRFCVYSLIEQKRLFLKKGSEIPDGWIIGKGTCWVNDGKKSYSIDVWEEKRYIEEGYIRGRLGNVVRNS